MRSRGALAGALLTCCCSVAAAMLACGSDGSSKLAPVADAGVGPAVDAASSVGDGASPNDDAGVDAGIPRTIAITTSAPASGTSPGGKAGATWAAYEDGTSGWHALVATASSSASYSFTSTAARWSIAVVCDDTGNAASTVAVFERTSATTSLDVTLDVDCALPPAAAYAIDGTLSHVPATTGWLDFAYPLDVRGSVLPIAGTSGDYEIVNVVGGTWDLLYGLRDDAFGPVTALAIVRAKAVAADATIDVDLSSTPSGIVPGSKNVVVHGVAATESFEPTIAFVTAGSTGLPVGPGSTPSGADVAFTYATVPAASALATDRYVVEIDAASEDHAQIRALAGSFHAPVDIEATLPAALAAPVTTSLGSAPYLRLTTAVGARMNDARYEVAYEVALTPRSHRRWRVSTDAALVTGGATGVVPDLSGVSGFSAVWALPSGDVAVTTAAHEVPSALGDGTIERVATTTDTFTP